jgi:protein-disulfide isomerase
VDERIPDEATSAAVGADTAVQDGATGADNDDRGPASVEELAKLDAAMPGTVPQRVTTADRGPGPTLRGIQPLWTAFLTPIAVMIGAAMIAGAVWFARDSRAPDSSTAGAAAPTQVATASMAAPTATLVPATSTAPTPAPRAGAAFEAYATEIGLDLTMYRACVNDTATAARIDAQQQVGIAAGVNGTPTFFINNKRLVGAMPWNILDEVIQAELKGSPTTLDGYSATVRQLAADNPPYFEILKAAPVVEGAALEGGAGARVKIIEFSDFQCPYCKRWVDQTYGSLRPLLGTDVSLSFVNFPLTQIHANATGAAVAAECAAIQGKFWEMHDLLFANQDAWSGLSPS